MTGLQPILVKFINSNTEIWQNPIFCFSGTISIHCYSRTKDRPEKLGVPVNPKASSPRNADVTQNSNRAKNHWSNNSQSQALMKKDTGWFLSRNLACLCGPPELPGIGSGTLPAIFPEHRDMAKDIGGQKISFKYSSENILATKEKRAFQKNYSQWTSLCRKREKMLLMALASNSIDRRNIGRHVPKWESGQSGWWRGASAKPVCACFTLGARGTGQMVWKGVRGHSTAKWAGSPEKQTAKHFYHHIFMLHPFLLHG